jgi:hypothetical protein
VSAVPPDPPDPLIAVVPPDALPVVSEVTSVPDESWEPVASSSAPPSSLPEESPPQAAISAEIAAIRATEPRIDRRCAMDRLFYQDATCVTSPASATRRRAIDRAARVE